MYCDLTCYSEVKEHEGFKLGDKVVPEYSARLAPAQESGIITEDVVQGVVLLDGHNHYFHISELNSQEAESYEAQSSDSFLSSPSQKFFPRSTSFYFPVNLAAVCGFNLLLFL